MIVKGIVRFISLDADTADLGISIRTLDGIKDMGTCVALFHDKLADYVKFNIIEGEELTISGNAEKQSYNPFGGWKIVINVEKVAVPEGKTVMTPGGMSSIPRFIPRRKKEAKVRHL